jgi:hypothetical protein
MPVKLASGTGDAVAIAVDSAYVYWASNTAVDGGTVGSVTRVPTGGGAPEPLATVPMSIGDIAVDATSVYFTAADDSVRKTPLAGGGGTTVSTGPAPATGTGPGPLAIDATNIYWLVYATGGPPALGAIFSAPLGGGPPATVLSPLLASSMAIDASHVYWLAEGTGGGGSISSTPKGGGASTVVVGDPKTPSRFRVYGSSLYWTSGFDANGAVSTAGVASVRGSPTPLVSGQVDPSAIAVDASGLYFATGKVNGLGLASPTLRRAPLAGGNATPIAADPLAFDIALGPAAVYWIGWDGSVWKVAKP